MGRDFMGQGAPPISQKLKQQVDVEARSVGMGLRVAGCGERASRLGGPEKRKPVGWLGVIPFLIAENHVW